MYSFEPVVAGMMMFDCSTHGFGCRRCQTRDAQDARDELQVIIQRLHNESSDWVDHVIQSFELAKLASEAIRYGSPEAREAILKALGSNYVVKDKKLMWKLPSPFREKVLVQDCTEWGERRDSNPRPSGPQPDALTS